MKSDSQWLKKLARSTFKNGKWTSENELTAPDGPFGLLLEDLTEAVEIYNQNAISPLRKLESSESKSLLATLLHGSAQLKLTRNGAFLDISIVRMRDFQTTEQPLTRLTPMMDVFGYPIWKRGTTEWSSDQVIKNALVHLLEASANG